MSDINSKPPKHFKLTGWHFLAMMLTFFGVIIAVNVVFVTSALDAFSGLVVKNSYVASQIYNEKIEQAATQKNLGWDLDLLVNKQGVDFILLDETGQAVSGKLVTVTLRNTKNTDHDMALLLNEAESGHYFAKLPEGAVTPNGSWWIDMDILQDNQLLYHYEEDRFIKFED